MVEKKVEATKLNSKLLLLPIFSTTRNSQIQIQIQIRVPHEKCKFAMLKIKARFENIFLQII